MGLVEYNAFTDILTKNLNNPQGFVEDATNFWQVLRITGNAVPLEEQVLRFQGYLFDDVKALPLNKKQLALLHHAAHAPRLYKIQTWTQPSLVIFWNVL